MNARRAAAELPVDRTMRAVVAVDLDEGAVRILDQRQLPTREEWIEARSVEDVCAAIRVMAVRGAPLLGVTAGFALGLAASATPRSSHSLGRCKVAGQRVLPSTDL